MDNRILISTCRTDILNQCREIGYTPRTVEMVRSGLNRIVEFYEERNEIYYDEKTMDEYILYVQENFTSPLIHKSLRTGRLGRAFKLKDYIETGHIKSGARTFKHPISEHYDKLLELIQTNHEWDNGQKERLLVTARSFFKFLLSNDVVFIDQVNEEVVRAYILHYAERAKLSSVNTIRGTLKKLLIWLYEMGHISKNFSNTLSFAVPSGKQIKKTIPESEMVILLESIDRNTPKGKRDYAMILLAMVTGLRSCDITNLKFENIDWIRGEIKLFQEKTNNELALPLTKDVGEAIQDYILYGRPKSELDTVFLSSRVPFNKLTRKGLYDAFNHRRESLGLKRCSVHGLRRTLGTNMVIAQIPVNTIAQVLGHADVASTKQYISLDSVHLKECALNLDGIERGNCNE